MFSITPKTLDAVNVVLGSLIDKLLGTIYDQMHTKALQRLIGPELGTCVVGIVHRALVGMVLDMVPASLSGYFPLPNLCTFLPGLLSFRRRSCVNDSSFARLCTLLYSLG